MKTNWRRVALQLTGLLLLGLWLVPAATAATLEDTVSLIKRILNDPMLPESVHGAQLVFKDKDPKKARDYLIADSLNYKILKVRGFNNSIDGAHIYPRDANTFDFSIFLVNEDQTEVSEEPDWAKLEPQWDAFVARYSPGLERISDWRRENWRSGGRGLFTIQYALKDKEAQVFRVGLNIRLADGKIGGVGTSDMRPLLAGKPVPLAPSPDTLLAAFRQAWTASRAGTPLRNLRFWDKIRQIFPDGKGGAIFNYAINVLADTEDGKTLIINANYAESSAKIEISSVITQEELKQLQQRPYTRVEDARPVWSSDGQQLYFNTTRNVKGYPWWRRGSLVYSLARGQVTGDKAAGLVLIDPIKSVWGNYGLYGTASPSPFSRYLAGSFGGHQQLLVLDLQQGNFYLPRRDPKWHEALVKKWRLPPNQLTGDLPWEMQGIVWPPEENALLVAMPFAWPDYDLFLLKREPTQPPQMWDLVPLDADRGDAIWPCLAPSGKLLGYGHSVPQTREEVKADKSKQWQLVLSDFDAITAKLSHQRSQDLDSEPTSISWDNKSQRWLVVTKTAMLWVQEVEGKLQAAPVPALKWGDISLHPTAAAVSPQGDKIAVAAELSKPQVYEKTEAVVAATIFLWDGKSEQVQPLFDPSLNGLPRYVFPATGSPWARIKGDVQKFGLESIADPAYFDTPTNTSQATPAAQQLEK
ncbi:MAG: hypothetical protein M3347_13940 [Armatimonadota bacterium]|nr:hypothetical protein [Armatimonadota bacterium]